MSLWKSLFGNYDEQPNATNSFMADQQKRAIGEAERAKQRRDEVHAEAIAKAPEEMAKYIADDEKHHADWRFSAKRQGEFIALEYGESLHIEKASIRADAITQVLREKGCDPALGGVVQYADGDWRFTGMAYYWPAAYALVYVSTISDPSFPVRAQPATLTLSGASYDIRDIPHRRLDEVYDAILRALADA